MKNKVLVKLIVPMFDVSFDIFIPVNETIFKIKKLMIKSLKDNYLSDENKFRFSLINKNNSRIYKNNEIVINTDIRNATELILISHI